MLEEISSPPNTGESPMVFLEKNRNTLRDWGLQKQISQAQNEERPIT